MRTPLFVTTAVLALSGTSCVSAYIASVGGDSGQTFDKIYLTDFNTAWLSVLDSLKNSQLEISNREGGYLQSKWIDNTAEKNFSESLGSADTYLKAQYRFRVAVSKGYYNGQPTVKISIQKEQMVQKDVLEGWHSKESDGQEERTLHYRIARIIYIKTRLAKLEEEKAQKEIENSSLQNELDLSTQPNEEQPSEKSSSNSPDSTNLEDSLPPTAPPPDPSSEMENPPPPPPPHQ